MKHPKMQFHFVWPRFLHFLWQFHCSRRGGVWSCTACRMHCESINFLQLQKPQSPCPALDPAPPTVLCSVLAARSGIVNIWISLLLLTLAIGGQPEGVWGRVVIKKLMVSNWHFDIFELHLVCESGRAQSVKDRERERESAHAHTHVHGQCMLAIKACAANCQMANSKWQTMAKHLPWMANDRRNLEFSILLAHKRWTYHNSQTYPWAQLVWGDNFSPVPAETTAPCRRPTPGVDCPSVSPQPLHCRRKEERWQES